MSLLLTVPPAGQEHAPDLFHLLDTIKVESEDIDVIKNEAELMFHEDREKKMVMDRIDGLYN